MLFLILGVIVGASPVETVCCMVARVSFALLFTAGNVCVERVFGMVRSKTLIFLFYSWCCCVMAIPGIAACVVCSILFPGLGGGRRAAGYGSNQRGHCRAGAVAVQEFAAIC